MNPTMDEIWTRLETFLQQNAPQIYAGLAPGATEAQIAEAEETCGFSLPDDARQSYLRHDGQSGDFGEPHGGTFIPDCFAWLSISKASYKWQGNIETLHDLEDDMPGGDGADFGVKPVFLDPAWVPFAKAIGGNQICLDFDPAPGGSIGQIVEVEHEAEGQRCLAPGFRAWLETVVSDLETGRLVWNAELQGYEYPEEDEDKDE